MSYGGTTGRRAPSWSRPLPKDLRDLLEVGIHDGLVEHPRVMARRRKAAAKRDAAERADARTLIADLEAQGKHALAAHYRRVYAEQGIDPADYDPF